MTGPEDTNDAERVRPFDSGMQHTLWLSRNCIGCLKFDAAKFMGRCDIDGALGDALMGDGTVPTEIADRMGHTEAHAAGEFPRTWPCPEREARS